MSMLLEWLWVKTILLKLVQFGKFKELQQIKKLGKYIPETHVLMKIFIASL